MPIPPYIDIHCHPELKTFLSANIEQNRKDCWQNINIGRFLELIDRAFLGNILGSQSSLSQLNTIMGTIALAGIYATEKAMVNGYLIKKFGIKKSLREVVRRLMRANHNNIIDPDLLDRISLPQTSYFDMFLETQEHLLKSRQINAGYNLMNSFNDYNPAKLNLVLTIEGGHNLCGQANPAALCGNMINNLITLRQSGKRYLFMSLAHVEQNSLCNHAFAMKILKHDDFMPSGRGITPPGERVIKEALTGIPRILIDIKHMSLESRKQYYQILERDYSSDNIPIVISHCGVTGVSWNEKPVVCSKKYRNWIKVRYFKPKGLKGTKFNPWSINIYDEEIKKIVDSNGLIGLNLDQRILGAKQKIPKERDEFFSPHEFNKDDFRLQLLNWIRSWDLTELFTAEDLESWRLRRRVLHILRELIADGTGSGIRSSDIINEEITELYAQLRQRPPSPRGIKHLCNNILHIVRVAGDEGWKHISIGSDFDGLISPVGYCKDSAEYCQLAYKLKSMLPEMALAIRNFPAIPDLNNKVDDIISGNAYRFLRNYMQ